MKEYNVGGARMPIMLSMACFENKLSADLVDELNKTWMEVENIFILRLNRAPNLMTSPAFCRQIFFLNQYYYLIELSFQQLSAKEDQLNPYLRI